MRAPSLLLAPASEPILSSVERIAALNSMLQWLSTSSSSPAYPQDQRRTHPLADRQAVYWIDLKDETVLLSRRDPGPELHDLLIAKTASPGDRPRSYGTTSVAGV
jgi:hypothetical protein